MPAQSAPAPTRCTCTAPNLPPPDLSSPSRSRSCLAMSGAWYSSASSSSGSTTGLPGRVRAKNCARSPFWETHATCRTPLTARCTPRVAAA